MAGKTLEESILNFKLNETRADQFINGPENATWRTSDGAEVPTVRKLVTDLTAVVEGAAAVVLEAKDEIIQARDDSLEALAEIELLVGTPYFAKRGDVANATIPVDRTVLRTAGRNAAGDGGGGLYRRSVSEPSDSDKVRSLDGAWWYFVAGDDVQPRLMSQMSNLVVPTSRDEIYITGADTVGDVYEGVYVRQSSAPSGLGDTKFRFTDASGAWWRKKETLSQTTYGTIVVLGSSTAAGQGVTGWFTPSQANDWTEHPNSWVGRLRTRLGDQARIINRSVGGQNTVGSIERFHTDVAPYAPDTVVFCTGWNNEPTADIPATELYRRAEEYIARLRTLGEMAKAIGAKPVFVVSQPGPWGDWYMQKFAASVLRREGYLVVDWSSVLSDRGQRTIAERFRVSPTDTIHTNDAGHAKYSAYFPDHYLLRGLVPPNPSASTALSNTDNAYLINAWDESDAEDGRAPMTLRFGSLEPRPAGVVVSVRAKANLASGNTSGSLLNVQLTNSGQNVSVRPNADGKWALFINAALVVSSPVNWDTTNVTNATLVVDAYEGLVHYYHNRNYVGTGSFTTQNNTLYRINFCGQAKSTRRLVGWHILGATVLNGIDMQWPHMEGYGDAGISHLGALFVAGSSAGLDSTKVLVNNIGNEPLTPMVTGHYLNLVKL